MSLMCLITTISSCLKAGFIRRSQVAWGFIPRRRDETAPPFFQGSHNITHRPLGCYLAHRRCFRQVAALDLGHIGIEWVHELGCPCLEHLSQKQKGRLLR